MIGAVPADVGRAGSAAAAFQDDDVIEADALAFQPETCGGCLERLVVRGAVNDRHRSEAERPRVLTVDVELARKDALDRIVVERERVPQIDERPLHDPDDGIDLFAVVAPRITEGEAAVGINHRVGRSDDEVLDVGVAVLDDRLSLCGSPFDVEGAHAFACECPLDARPREAVQHHAVEGAVAGDRNRVGRVVEGGH